MAAADRLLHVRNVIEPALARGAAVLCDRYVYATYGVFVHRGIEASFLTEINAGIPRPDHAIYLRASASELAERLRLRDGDHLQFEERDLRRIESIIATYECLGPDLIRVNASDPIEDVTASILEATGL